MKIVGVSAWNVFFLKEKKNPQHSTGHILHIRGWFLNFLLSDEMDLWHSLSACRRWTPLRWSLFWGLLLEVVAKKKPSEYISWPAVGSLRFQLWNLTHWFQQPPIRSFFCQSKNFTDSATNQLPFKCKKQGSNRCKLPLKKPQRNTKKNERK